MELFVQGEDVWQAVGAMLRRPAAPMARDFPGLSVRGGARRRAEKRRDVPTLQSTVVRWATVSRRWPASSPLRSGSSPPPPPFSSRIYSLGAIPR
jgi:hypothetical protein